MKLATKDKVFVGIQFILFILYVFNAQLYPMTWPSFISSIGLVLFILGVGTVLIAMLQLHTNLSPFPSPKSSATLVQTGIYKFIRHPIYTGILGSALGYSLFTGSVYKIMITVGLYLLFYFKSRYEEEQLTCFFTAYEDYKRRTGCFLPKFFKK